MSFEKSKLFDMCGICGVLNFDGKEVSPVLLKKMTDSIAHRGPDGEGWYRNKALGFGHRRLAIVDLSPLGHQPMVTPDSRYVLTYNGEIYNFLEIRADLVARGHSFISKTDSEVVLHAWAEWGSECVNKFNGMFAFAIWDSVEENLFLVRDRYGIKPLYYAQVGNVLIFGSEQRAIREHPAIVANLDKRALLEYFTFQNIFTDRTFVEDIKILPAGTFMSISARTGKINKTQYWDYHFSEPKGKIDAREYKEELNRLLRQAVSRQLLADVEIGSYLSGGMDSGTLTALAATELPYIKTFTCGFDLSSATGVELGYDERVRAEAMSALFKTEHYEMVLKSGDMERCLDTVVQAIEEPRVGQSYPNYYVARLASKFVKVVLSGAGGDELFGGYPWRYYIGSDSKDFEEYIDSYYAYWHRLVDNSQLRKLFSPIWNEVSDVWTRDIFRDVFSNHANELNTPQDYVNHSLYFEAKTFLHGLLVVEDKLSMANGLETRIPFLDNDLVDFAMTCPVDLKVRNMNHQLRSSKKQNNGTKDSYYQQTSDGKSILRDVMSEIIPSSITDSPKKGFSSPDASWFRSESMQFVVERLFSENSKLFQMFNFEFAKNLYDDHTKGEVNRRLLIWSLLSFKSILDREL
jgi:asparagine synthase (glutamine-hydrolysing)